MKSTSTTGTKVVTFPKSVQHEQPNPERISALARRDRRLIRKRLKDVVLNFEEAKSEMTAFAEDRGHAFDTLDQLVFMIDDLFSTCITFIKMYPGVDDLGDGHKLRPQHQNFEERKAYGKVYKVVDEVCEVRVGDVIYTAEFSVRTGEGLPESENVDVCVKNKHLWLRFDNGKKAKGRITSVEKVQVPPALKPSGTAL